MWVALLMLLLPFLPASSQASQCPFPAMFNFGDSNSDTGGLVAAFPSEARPYGETYFKEPAGRFSDGRLVVDFVAEALGLPLLSPYLQSLGSNFTNGANFATAGASVSLPASARPNGWLSPFYLLVQLNQFNQFKAKALELFSQGKSVDVLPLPSTFGSALYTLDIGQNDFTAQFASGTPLDQFPAIFAQVVDTIGNVVESLYTDGARFFWITNMGPLGCYPGNLASNAHNASDLDANGCLIFMNNLVANFNDLLRNKSFLLQTQLYGASVIYVDTNAIKYQLWANGPANGFNYTTTACCGTGGQFNYDTAITCTNSAIVNGQIVTAASCSDPSSYVSWDGVHFTESANRYVATQILSGNYFQPPFALKQMCNLTQI